MTDPTEFFTPEYRDLCIQYEAFTRSPHGRLIDGTAHIRVSNYANYWFCPLSFPREQAKLKPLWIPTEEDLEEEKKARDYVMDKGTRNHGDHAIEISKTHPNTPVSDDILQPSSLATRERVKRVLAPEVEIKVEETRRLHPETEITNILVKSIEKEITKASPDIDLETKDLVEKVDNREAVITTESEAGSQELRLVLLHRGIWFSGKFDGAFFEDGRVIRVDEFKSSNSLERSRAYVAQSEVYCLMLSRATGQTDFPYTLSLGQRPVSISKNWDESRVLEKLDTASEYFTGEREAKLPDGFRFGMCDGCYAISRCPVREDLRGAGGTPEKRFRDHLERVRAAQERRKVYA